MKQLAVASGKGGTGKTTLSACLALLAAPVVVADCDVDAPDLHLILRPEVEQEGEFQGRLEPRVDPDRCTRCGRCDEHCRFGAIREGEVDPWACEGCGVCARVCPEEAIRMSPRVAGRWFVSRTRCGPLVHAQLGVAEENSGKLVSLVRQKACEVAEREGRELVIVDGPPGIGCPVISTLSGVDLVLAVAEPTPSGLHDLARLVGLARHFGIPLRVCLNKADLHGEARARLLEYCRREGLPVVGEVPFDEGVTRALARGRAVVEEGDGPACRAIRRIWESLRGELR